MDNKEVLELVKELVKCKNDDDAVLNVLKQLNTGIVPSEKLLRETKVGVEVNKFKRSNNAEISKLVKKMIGAWKDAINRSKKAKLGGPATATGGVASNNSTTTGGNDSSEGNATKQDKYISSKPRNAANDGVDTNLYNIPLRDKVIRAFYDVIAKESEHPPAALLSIAKSVENEMNNAHNYDTAEKNYKERYRIIYSNLIAKNNPDLKHKIANGDLSAQFLATCDVKELAPDHLKQKMEEIAKQNLFNAQGATIERSVTDRFTCGKCKEKKVSYYQLQTRSADEPLTTFCTCEACGNRWKFS